MTSDSLNTGTMTEINSSTPDDAGSAPEPGLLRVTFGILLLTIHIVVSGGDGGTPGRSVARRPARLSRSAEVAAIAPRSRPV